MTPLSPDALKHLIATLPPEKHDPFEHLSDLSPSQLLQRRLEITQQSKHLEQEKKRIDEELQQIHSDAELRIGINAPEGWVLKQRSRSSWEYSPEVLEVVKKIQQEAQRDGRAIQHQTFHLSFIRP